VASSWRGVTALCHRVLETLPDLAAASTSRIRKDLQDYAAVPLEEHLGSVTEQQRRRLEAISERRPLDAGDLEQAAQLAQRRARQGVSVDVLIGAYHVGDRELWRALCANAGDATDQLPDVASLMLDSLHAISTVLASAHGEVVRQLQGHRITLSQRFVELLGTGLEEPETYRVAQALGFRPEGRFVAMVWRPEQRHPAVPAPLQRETDRGAGAVIHAYHDDEVVFLAQHAHPERLAGLAHRHLRQGGTGVGLAREGLGGAGLSMGDARLALVATSSGERVRQLEDIWHEAALLSTMPRIAPVVAHAVDVARANPHLADAVVAFAETSMSVARTARVLHLHANTVTYRLERWNQLAGWDPRNFAGLSRSVVACRVARS
jgi:PAS domain-containing protein